MNICMFTNTYAPHVGGVARSVEFFASDLQNLGHRVLVIAPEYEGEASTVSGQPHVLRLPAIQKFNGSDFSLRIPVPFMVSEQIDRFSPDIIHSHHPYLLGDAALRSAKQRNLPIVFTHHTLYEEYTHYVSETSKMLRQFVMHLATEYANLCTAVAAPSQSIVRLITERGVRVPIIEIPTGVDVDYFSKGDAAAFKKRFGIPSDAFVIGHLGRLAPEKNLDYLAHAVADALAAHEKAYFLVVGDGPSKRVIEEVFRNNETASRLIQTGTLQGAALRDAYSAMDLFVFASKSETQGMVLTEAMAARVPVVALDASGAREVVMDGENGRLLDETTSVHAYAKVLQSILERPESISDWRQATVKRAEEFSRKTCAKKLEALYRSIYRKNTEESVRTETEFAGFEEVLQRIKVEWELASEKLSAAIQTVQDRSE